MSHRASSRLRLPHGMAKKSGTIGKAPAFHRKVLDLLYFVHVHCHPSCS